MAQLITAMKTQNIYENQKTVANYIQDLNGLLDDGLIPRIREVIDAHEEKLAAISKPSNKLIVGCPSVRLSVYPNPISTPNNLHPLQINLIF
jgi:hypothetical protein